MHRGVLHFGMLLLLVAPPVEAFAHDAPPDAYAVLSADTQGPRAVSLSLGVAIRRSAQSYQFVCPKAWHDQFPAPAAALADGTIVLGTSRGLYLLREDGALRVHPDPAAVGRSVDVVRSVRGVFSLRDTPQGSEVLAVEAPQVRVLWKDAKSMYTVAAADDMLVLARASGAMLEQVTIAAADGAELERQMALLDRPVDFAFARANTGAAYVLVVFRDGTMALGTLRANAFVKLVEAETTIAGPLRVENNTLLALDGKLAQLLDTGVTPLADAHNVVCLAEHDGLKYACEADGITRVTGPALADPLFRFDWLVAPDLERLTDAEESMGCYAQWQDLLSDIQLSKLSTAPDTPVTAGGGGPLPGGAPAAGAVGAPAIAGGPAVVPEQAPQAGGSSCTLLSGRRARGTAGAHDIGIVVLLAAVRLRRRFLAASALRLAVHQRIQRRQRE